LIDRTRLGWRFSGSALVKDDDLQLQQIVGNGLQIVVMMV